MQEKIRLNNFDILDINTCPVLYYARKKLDIIEDSPFSYRGKIIVNLISSASRKIILEYYSKKLSLKDIDTKLLSYFFEELKEKIPAEQIESIIEIFTSKFFAAEAEKLYAFLKENDYFNMSFQNALVKIERDDFIYETNIDFIYPDKNLFFISSSVESYSYRYYNMNVLGAFIAATESGIEIKSMSVFPYLMAKNAPTSITLPSDEQINYFLMNLNDVTNIIKREDYYPKPQWRCYGCKFEQFCKSFRGG